MFGLRTFFALVFALLFIAFGASAGTKMPSEVLVSTNQNLIDAEYSKCLGGLGGRCAGVYSDQNCNTWLFKVDQTTGMFTPSDGRGTLLQANSLCMSDLKIVGNGPEWYSGPGGDQVVLTNFTAGQPHSKQTAHLASIIQDKTGAWNVQSLMPNKLRNAPYASFTPNDPTPTISYVDPNGNHYYCYVLSCATTEQKVTCYLPSAYSMRFVKGTHKSLFATPDTNGIRQIWMYDLPTGNCVQLTFDDGSKDMSSVPWGWLAPELGNQIVISTIVNNNELRTYTLTAGTPQNASGQQPWTQISSAYSATGGTLSSPEIFTYNGTSYVFYTSSKGSSPYQSQIWLASAVPQAGFPRQLTPDTDDNAARMDPEFFILNGNGPMGHAVIYYNRFDTTSGPPGFNTSRGVYMTATGL